MIKAYQQDWNYKEHWRTRLDQEQGRKIAMKLIRHFKIIPSPFIFFCNSKNGHAGYDGYISLPKKNIALGMICHEVGHLFAYKYGRKGHTKKAYKYIHRVYKYAVRYIPVEILLGLDKLPLLLEQKAGGNLG